MVWCSERAISHGREHAFGSRDGRSASGACGWEAGVKSKVGFLKRGFLKRGRCDGTQKESAWIGLYGTEWSGGVVL